MQLVTITLLSIFVFGGTVLANPTDFSGTWVLDKNSMDAWWDSYATDDVVQRIIVQNKRILSVEHRVIERHLQLSSSKHIRDVYNIDGSETINNARGKKIRLKLTWIKGGTQVEFAPINIEMLDGRTGQLFTVEFTERWELAKGGRILNVHQTYKGKNMEKQDTLIFHRKESKGEKRISQ